MDKHLIQVVAARGPSPDEKGIRDFIEAAKKCIQELVGCYVTCDDIFGYCTMLFEVEAEEEIADRIGQNIARSIIMCRWSLLSQTLKDNKLAQWGGCFKSEENEYIEIEVSE